jgi:hypothetical protein
MSFAASGLLASIKSSFISATVGRFDRLRVDGCSARLPLAPFLLAHIAAQTIMDALPSTR